MSERTVDDALEHAEGVRHGRFAVGEENSIEATLTAHIVILADEIKRLRVAAQQCLQCGGRVRDGVCQECRERDNHCEELSAEVKRLREENTRLKNQWKSGAGEAISCSPENKLDGATC